MINFVSFLTDMFRYGDWVAERLATSVISAELQEHERVVWVFNHVVNARRIWLERVRDGSVAVDFNRVLPLDELMELQRADTEEWCQWLGEGGEARLESLCAYKNLRGNSFENKIYHIAQHVVNHTTHHFHEIVYLIRSSGHVPPTTDFIAYVRLNLS